jgi:hypothetical protein
VGWVGSVGAAGRDRLMVVMRRDGYVTDLSFDSKHRYDLLKLGSQMVRWGCLTGYDALQRFRLSHNEHQSVGYL